MVSLSMSAERNEDGRRSGDRGQFIGNDINDVSENKGPQLKVKN